MPMGPGPGPGPGLELGQGVALAPGPGPVLEQAPSLERRMSRQTDFPAERCRWSWRRGSSRRCQTPQTGCRAPAPLRERGRRTDCQGAAQLRRAAGAPTRQDAAPALRSRGQGWGPQQTPAPAWPRALWGGPAWLPAAGAPPPPPAAPSPPPRASSPPRALAPAGARGSAAALRGGQAWRPSRQRPGPSQRSMPRSRRCLPTCASERGCGCGPRMRRGSDWWHARRWDATWTGRGTRLQEPVQAPTACWRAARPSPAAGPPALQSEKCAPSRCADARARRGTPLAMIRRPRRASRRAGRRRCLACCRPPRRRCRREQPPRPASAPARPRCSRGRASRSRAPAAPPRHSAEGLP
mmetsp:Transcript_13440/g.51261  ORF Transcript_13440/g.51261 Transcript_13440/m.51261 type:complete len:353 (-) Transcript_13440:596-1654(-)